MGCAAAISKPAVKDALKDVSYAQISNTLGNVSAETRTKMLLALTGRGMLASYFLTGYLKGEDAPHEDLRQAGYTMQYDDKLSADVFYHEPTGITVWSEALDLSTPGRDSSEIRIGFHYTTPWGFSTVTHRGDTAVEIWASFKAAGDAFFGEGIYASQQDPHEFGSIEAVLYNNYNVKGDETHKLREYWDRALCCIPILVDHEVCIDVRKEKHQR